jgi:sulfotransferase family protein
MKTRFQGGAPDDAYKSGLSDFAGRLVFIMGCHRSGTSMLYHLLAYTGAFNYISAYDIIKYDELLRNRIENREEKVKSELDAAIRVEKNRGVDNLPVGADCPEEYRFLLAPKPPRWFLNFRRRVETESFAPHLTRQTHERFLEICSKKQFLAGDAKPLLLKNPNDFYFNFGAVHRMFPQARMIFIHRHPLHVLNSYIAGFGAIAEVKNAYAELLDPAYRDLFRSPIERRIYRRAFGGSRLPRYIAEGLVKSYRYYIDNIRCLPEDQFLTIRYEDLCREPEEHVIRIGKWLKLEAEPRIPNQFVQPRRLGIADRIRFAYAEKAEQMRPYLAIQNYPLFPGSIC